MTSTLPFEQNPGRSGAQPFANTTHTHDLTLDCDVCVIGSGPAGSVAAWRAAAEGKSVIVLEEGRAFAPSEFDPDANHTLGSMVREHGLRAARGEAFVPTMAAIGLGGGTLINSAICARAPSWTLQKWAEQAQVPWLADLAPHYARIESFWGVAPTPAAVQGKRNQKFKEGCDALGISCEPIVRNVIGCRGSAECFSGCRNGAKQTMDRTFLRDAEQHGARIVTRARVTHLSDVSDRGAIVHGQLLADDVRTPAFALRVHARRVILAAGCMQTPVLLQRSGLDVSRCGDFLQMHPGLAILALFAEEILPWEGATQGYHSLHFLKEGLKLEVLWAPASLMAARLPGVAHEFADGLMSLRHGAPFDVICATEKSFGRVRAKRYGYDPDLYMKWDKGDIARLMRGMKLLCDIAWAAGATRILPGVHGVVDAFEKPHESDVFLQGKLGLRDVVCAANHVFGSTRMAKDAAHGTVDELGRVHGYPALYVADTGVFPASPSVNPMLTVMALADRIAQHCAESLPSAS